MCGINKETLYLYKNIALKGRDKMDKYIKRNYESVSQVVIQLFVSFFSIHEEQKSLISRQKQPVLDSIQAREFLTHLQMDLMDLRNLSNICSCHRKHNLILHVIDHFTKYSWLYPLKNSKQNMYWNACLNFVGNLDFLRKRTLNSLMSQFCENNGITQLHGAPRKPSTQGLVERNNETVKQNIRNILKEKKQKSKSLVSGTRGSY